VGPGQLTSGLLEAAPDAIVGVNAEGVVVLMNAQAERLFGWPRDELLGRPLDLLVPDGARDIHPQHRAGYLDDPRPRPMGAGMELAGRRRDGSEFPAEISLSAIETDDGIVVSAAVRDVTNRKLIEQQLREKNAELERLGRVKDSFLANMSHELRTPLNAIIGFTGTLLMQLPGPLNDEQIRQLRIVEQNGKHLLSIINDLLDLAKIDSGTVGLTLQEVDCAGVIKSVVESLQPLADEKGLALTTDLDAAALVRSDARALGQILINLVNNAIKFTDAGSVSVTLCAAGDRRGTTIAVADTGPGIPAEDLDQLFSAFERGRGRAARNREGTGLGLHISQKLAGLADIAIRVESTVGVGSTFVLEFADRR
jgi:protein-histidine pros-kinase